MAKMSQTPTISKPNENRNALKSTSGHLVLVEILQTAPIAPLLLC